MKEQDRPIEVNVDQTTGMGTYKFPDTDQSSPDLFDAAEHEHPAPVSGHVDVRQFDQLPDSRIPVRQSQQASEGAPIRRRPGRVFRGIRNFGIAGIAGLSAIGALSVANNLGFDIDLLPGDKTTVDGGVKDVKTEVVELDGIVTGRINSTVDLQLRRTLNHINPIPDCNIQVNEQDLKLSGILTIGLTGLKVIPTESGVEVKVNKFDEPEMGLPLERPVLPEGFSRSGCVQKKGKEKIDSPENVPVLLAGKLLEASSKRIGECVINKANDDGSDMQRLLSGTIARNIATIRGIDQKDVTVTFDYEDTDDGLKAIQKTVEDIIKKQKNETGAKVTIDTAEVQSCDLHDMRAVLTPAAA